MVYVANSITNQYAMLEEGRRWWWACAVLEGVFFIIYNCAAQTEHFRIGRERDKKGCVCYNSVETLSFYARPCLSKISKPQKKKQGQPDSFLNSFLSLFVSSAVAVSFLANFSLFS